MEDVKAFKGYHWEPFKDLTGSGINKGVYLVHDNSSEVVATIHDRQDGAFMYCQYMDFPHRHFLTVQAAKRFLSSQYKIAFKKDAEREAYGL